MKKISSLILSIMIHILLSIVLLTTYLIVEKQFQSDKISNEKTLYINLASYKPCSTSKKKEEISKKSDSIERKKEKKHPIKKIQKKTEIKKQKIKRTQSEKKKEVSHLKTKQDKKQNKRENNHNNTKNKTIKEQSNTKVTKKIKENNLAKNKCFDSNSDQTNKKNYAENYLSENINLIRKLLVENLYYPRKAKKRHIEGVVKVRFKLSPTGSIKEIQIISDAPSILSKASIRTLKNIEEFFPKPNKEITIILPITYKLIKEN